MTSKNQTTRMFRLHIVKDYSRYPDSTKNSRFLATFTSTVTGRYQRTESCRQSQLSRCISSFRKTPVDVLLLKNAFSPHRCSTSVATIISEDLYESRIPNQSKTPASENETSKHYTNISMQTTIKSQQVDSGTSAWMEPYDGPVLETVANIPHQPQHETNENFESRPVCSFRNYHNYNSDITGDEPMPPPLPEPKFTFLRRVLQQNEQICTWDSAAGQERLVRALMARSTAPYYHLMAHFCNQSDPAYCGITTLLVVLNALGVDPGRRWKGGWRYFGNEDMLLQTCCMDAERIRRIGIGLSQFAQLATCQGLNVTVKRPHEADIQKGDIPGGPSSTSPNEPRYSVQSFREDILHAMHQKELSQESSLSTRRHKSENGGTNSIEQCAEATNLQSILVVSYARSAVGQTGDGHFSPLAAYDAASDSVLVLDVARFKYPPTWISVELLYQALQPHDTLSGKPRGWFVLKPPRVSRVYQGSQITDQVKIPVERVPSASEPPACPAHDFKITYCPLNEDIE